MLSRSEHRVAPRPSGPPTRSAAPQASRHRRPLLPALILATMLLVAASFAALPAYAHVGDQHHLWTTDDTTGDFVMAPDISYDWSTGEYLAAWQDDYGNTGDLDAWVQAFAVDGTPVAPAVHPGFSSYGDLYPKVATAGSGWWLVTWVTRTGAGDQLKGRMVDAAGVMGPEIATYLTTAATEQITSVDVGATTNGWYLVVFDRYNTVTTDTDVLCARVNGDGSLAWTATIAQYTETDYRASVAQIGKDFLVAWTMVSVDTTHNIFGRQVSGVDGSMGSEFIIHDDAQSADVPSVASDVDSDADGTEHFLVTFADQYELDTDGTDYDIGYAFVTGGAVESTDVFEPTYTGALEYQSSASFTGVTDTFFIAWARSSDWLSGRDVYGAYLRRDGTNGWSEPLAVDQEISEASPQSTCLWTAIGSVAVVWDQWLYTADPPAWDTNIYERDWTLKGPNLVDDGAEWQYFGPTSVVPGTPWSAECDVRNDGTVASEPFTVAIFASADTTLDVLSDYYLGFVEMPGLPAGYYADCDWSGTFPGVPAGTYYVLWYLDPDGQVLENDETDNVAYLSDYQLTVGEAVNLHDFSIWYQGFEPMSVAPGDTFAAVCAVWNDSNLASGAFTVGLYVSTDTTIDSSDYLIGEVSMADMPAYSATLCEWTGLFPDTVPGGNYYVGWIIDPANAVAEGNEDDNASYLPYFQLVVSAPAAAAFSGTPVTGGPGLVVTFTDESAGTVNSWTWDFGDPDSGAANTSRDQNPSHAYAATGSYDVTLTITNAYGADTEEKLGYITVTPPIAAAFSVENAIGSVPLVVTFTDTTTGGPDGWTWDFGDGTTSTDQNPTHTYADPGYYDVTLTAAKGVATDVATQEGVVAAGFTDTLPDNWAFHYILACATADMVQGYWENKYKPAEEVTRGQMAVYLARALAGGDEDVPPGPETPTFTDVATDYWAYRYVEYVAGLDVVQGYGGTNYKPDVVVNRGQMGVFIARAVADPIGDAGVPDASAPDPAFPDVTATNDWGWCYKYVQYIATLDPVVVNGYPGGLYKPELNVTRDQMAVYVQRAFALPMYAP